MTQWPARLVLVGAGKMGGAMALGWLRAGLEASALTIIEPNPSEEIASLAASRGVALNPAKSTPPDVLVLAVKPQSLDATAPQIAPLADARTLVLSILAGKTIANLKARLPRVGAVVRAMPNTPAAIGRGVTAAFASPAGERGAAALDRASVRRGRRFSLARRRTRDRRGDRDFGRRASLRVRADGGAGGRRGKARPAARAFDESRARHGRRVRAS